MKSKNKRVTRRVDAVMEAVQIAREIVAIKHRDPEHYARIMRKFAKLRAG